MSRGRDGGKADAMVCPARPLTGLRERRAERHGNRGAAGRHPGIPSLETRVAALSDTVQGAAASGQASEAPSSGTAVLALAALGVVYGDIGTSPIYYLRECFRGGHSVPLSPESVLGVLSLVFWALIIIISIKYLAVVMRADNRGEGGILALMALVTQRGGPERGRRSVLIALGLAGAALLYADAMITPAISVLSALEGLTAENNVLQPLVLPGAMAILFVLFAAQRRGSARLGVAFGPLMLLWFAVLSVLGIYQIAQNPGVLTALSPTHAIRFFSDNGFGGFKVLGTVFLVVTGGEALYADLGHFGRRPIQVGWFTVVLPALLLNYFGQGALLLRQPEVVDHVFYFMGPRWFLTPMVLMATYATVIASQAVISGAFSLTSQAVQLGYSPRLAILQTSSREIGQVYVPATNRMLLVGTLALLLIFRESGALAGAYGLAVSSTMLLTTLLLYPVTRELWGWSRPASAVVILAFLIPDVLFFASNMTKIGTGGWMPLVVAASVYGLMTIWERGRGELSGLLREAGVPEDVFISDIRESHPTRVPGISVFLTGNATGIPRTLLHNYKHNQVLHQIVLLVTVQGERVPTVPLAEQLTVKDVGEGLYRAVVRYGFSESPDLPAMLARIDPKYFRVDPMRTSYFLGRETLIMGEGSRFDLRTWTRRIFAFMSRNALDAAKFFHLPPNRVVEIGVQIQF
jgi:KUP system potassium uptake protein